MSAEEVFKDGFLEIMLHEYGLDAVEVEDFVDSHIEHGLDVDDTPNDLANIYAEKYNLDSIKSTNHGRSGSYWTMKSR